MKNLFLSIVFFLAMSVVQSQEPYLLVGSYTGGTSKGIYVYKFNTGTGATTLIDSAVTSNPSYLAISPDKKYVYAANENGSDKGYGGGITAFSFDKKTGKLTELNHVSSEGNHPCYITTTKNGKWVAVGNYSSGTLAIYPVQKDGSLGTATQVIKHEGRSVNSERQEGPHVHCTVFSPDEKFLFVSDLGIDKIMTYAFDSKTGKLTPAPVPFTEVEAGDGPRHLTFSPSGKFAYLVTEMRAGINVYKYLKTGQLDFVQQAPALAQDFTGVADGADIHVSPDGKFLYSSNRGQANDIAIFSINQHTGTIMNVGHQPSLGKTPRNFNFDPSGNFLLVAHQNSPDIVVFKRDKKTGLLQDSGVRIAVDKSVCIKWID